MISSRNSKNVANSQVGRSKFIIHDNSQTSSNSMRARKRALEPVGLRSRTPAHMKRTENIIRTHTKHKETSQITLGKHKENAWRMQRHIQKTQINHREFTQKHTENCQDFARNFLGFCQHTRRILPGF